MVSTAVSRETVARTGPATTTRLALVLEYDGTNYYGFQLQRASPTIQKEVEQALRRLTGETIRVTAAGRTDAGVHARGQVISFGTGSSLARETFVSGLNHYLPGDIAVKAAYRPDDSFDARRRAVSREYRYSILNSGTRSPMREGFAHRVVGNLGIEAMHRAAEALVGEHDLASFASGIGGETKSTVRRVYRAEVKKDGDLIRFDIVASGFLRHQVRSTAGCLVRIGLGKMSQDEFRAIVAARKPGLAGPALPACGLCLMCVDYAPVRFRKRYHDQDVQHQGI